MELASRILSDYARLVAEEVAWTPRTDPFCGEELVPHATFPDGSAAPIICTREPHGVDTWHHNDETGTSWLPDERR